MANVPVNITSADWIRVSAALLQLMQHTRTFTIHLKDFDQVIGFSGSVIVKVDNEGVLLGAIGRETRCSIGVTSFLFPVKHHLSESRPADRLSVGSTRDRMGTVKVFHLGTLCRGGDLCC